MGYVIFGGGRISGGGGSGGNIPTGIEIGTLAVGSSVFMNVNGTAREFLVVNQGIPGNSSLYDSSCNGTWLLMKDLYNQHTWDSSNSNYSNSDIHTYLDGTFFGLLDSNIQSAIKQIKIPYWYGLDSSGSLYSGSNGLSTKVFLLGGYEVGFTESMADYISIDGACLSYFSGTSGANNKRIAYLNGTATHWWLRTGTDEDTTNRAVVRVQSNGTYSAMTCYDSYGIRPALILPSTALVDENTMAVKGVL